MPFDHTADGRVWPDPAQTAPCQTQGVGHEAGVDHGSAGGRSS